MQNFFSYRDAEKFTALTVGEKATNLSKLGQLGFNVPEWVVIPEERLLSLIPDPKKITVVEIEKTKFPEDIIEDISAFFGGTEYFAVRSSARDEDGSIRSFAGLYDSFLYVRKDQLAQKIMDVWKSGFSDHVRSYRSKNNLEARNTISVIIQRMVNSEISGVAFGMNPRTGNRREIVINSVYGLGEGLVSGELVADEYITSKNGISTNLALKNNQFQFSNQVGSGIVRVDVRPEMVKASSLSENQIKEIADVLSRSYESEGKYQDIEFAYEKGQLYLLQTRPVTAIGNLPDTSGKYIVWDNSNIVESYPGITLPLTFSYIIKLYEKAYRQLVQLLGVSQHEIEKNSEHFANMLGLLNGRVYYNLRSWYKMISILPGYSINAGFMEKMMGVKESFKLDDIEKNSKLRDYIRLMQMLISISKNLFTLEKQKKKFTTFFDGFVESYDGLNTDALSAEELMNLYNHVESVMLERWKAPLVNDFFTMIYFGILNKTAISLFGNETNIHNDLLSGTRDMISTKPVYLIKLIVNTINTDEGLKSHFEKSSSEEIWKMIQQQKLPGIDLLVNEYINDFGDRYVGELKLETKTYTQNPAQFISLLQSYIQTGASFNGNGKNEEEIRAQAEEKINIALKRKYFKKAVIKHLIRKTRKLVSGRENLRLYRTRAFGKTRIIFRSIAKRFYAEGIIEHPDDLFYLTKEEIFDFIKGTSVNYAISELVQLRKKEFDAFRTEQVQTARIKSYGMVYHGNNFMAPDFSVGLDGDIKGIACCKGIVKGRVRVVADIQEISNLHGDILVTVSTDPGWITLFPSVSGILVERGSLLSHSAIVSREMGIPCIVGINDLLKKIRTGDIVEMDGSTGHIKICERHTGNGA